MKLSALTIALTSLLTPTGATLLRASKKHHETLADDEPGVVSATIFLDHVASSSPWDDATVADAFLTAYNAVHDGSYTIVNGFVSNHIEMPEEEALGFSRSSHYYAVGWYSGIYCKSTRRGSVLHFCDSHSHTLS